MPFAIDAASTSSDYRRVAEQEEKMRYGPHYKNRNAAGRLLLINRITPDAPSMQRKERLMGPAYKNRRIIFTSGDSMPSAQPKHERLMGPRYKNRHAKAHQ